MTPYGSFRRNNRGKILLHASLSHPRPEQHLQNQTCFWNLLRVFFKKYPLKTDLRCATKLSQVTPKHSQDDKKKIKKSLKNPSQDDQFTAPVDKIKPPGTHPRIPRIPIIPAKRCSNLLLGASLPTHDARMTGVKQTPSN